MGRADRLKEVYEYVRTKFPIHTQSDFAEWLKYNRTYISSAMHGNEKNLTDKLFVNICESFPDVFDLNYLLTGDGQLLTIEKEVKSEDIEKAINPTLAPQAIDYTFLIEKAVEKATAYADKTISTLENQIARYEKELDAKSEEIKRLQARIHELEAFTTVIRTDDPLYVEEHRRAHQDGRGIYVAAVAACGGDTGAIQLAGASS